MNDSISSSITWRSRVDPGVWKPLRSWPWLVQVLENLHHHRALELRRDGTDLRARVQFDLFDFIPDDSAPRSVTGRSEYPAEALVTVTLGAPYTMAGSEYDGLVTAGAIEIWLSQGLSTTLGSFVTDAGE